MSAYLGTRPIQLEMNALFYIWHMGYNCPYSHHALEVNDKTASRVTGSFLRVVSQGFDVKGSTALEQKLCQDDNV